MKVMKINVLKEKKKKQNTGNIKSKLQVVEMCINCVGPNCEKRIPA